MNNEIKFPTLLGLGVLIVGLIVGVAVVAQQQIFQSHAGQSGEPKNVSVTNLSANSVSIFWQTDIPTPGFVQVGPQTNLGLTFKDERDTDAPVSHKIHFVTITGLSPKTTYYYKISSGGTVYPQKDPDSFQTTEEVTNQNLSPIIGTVLDINGQPANESLVILDIPGAQKLATVTKTAGNYIIPLAQIRTADLSTNFLIDKKELPGQLTVIGPDHQSKVIIKLPLGNRTIPPVKLGQDLDITTQTDATQSANTINKYDINNDGIVNALDISIVINNIGKNPIDKRADLNNDGVVDLKDLDIITKAIQFQQ